MPTISSIPPVDAQQYIDILEKTNQQLSLWYNPYGIMVAALGVITALLAIVFTFILWRQGKEYKDAFNNFLAEQKKSVNNEVRKSIKKVEIVLDQQIKNANEKMNSVSGETKKNVEKEIAKLKEAKESLETSSTTLTSLGGVYPITGTGITGISGLGYGGTSNLFGPIGNGTYVTIPTCSKCGHCNSYGSKFCSECGNKL